MHLKKSYLFYKRILNIVIRKKNFHKILNVLLVKVSIYTM